MDLEDYAALAFRLGFAARFARTQASIREFRDDVEPALRTLEEVAKGETKR